MLDILFSLPVLSCLLVTGSAAFGVSVVTRFVPDKTKLDQSLTRAEKALEKLRKEITGNQATMKQSQAEVEMLKPVHERLDDYHEQLTQMHLELERKNLADGDRKPNDDKGEDAFGRRKRFKL
jgi:septal ring factor EnvC (AmiA/AmiB activator)